MKGGIRPVNAPERRLYGLAYFIANLPAYSFRVVWYDLLNRRMPVRETIQGLIKLHRTSGNPGWGKAQALELIGNIVLPYMYYEANMTKSNGFADYIAEVYFNLPSSGRYACLHRFGRIYVDGHRFYKDQAYLHLYQQYCRKVDCAGCPILPAEETD
jgi:hypothetical protein